MAKLSIVAAIAIDVLNKKIKTIGFDGDTVLPKKKIARTPGKSMFGMTEMYRHPVVKNPQAFAKVEV